MEFDVLHKHTNNKCNLFYFKTGDGVTMKPVCLQEKYLLT